jgi:hypothetical protein
MNSASVPKYAAKFRKAGKKKASLFFINSYTLSHSGRSKGYTII